jgi:hypothetical protein
LRRATFEQLLHRTAPEHLAEDARRAQHLARLGLEAFDACLRHREHATGQAIAFAFGDRADQLFEIERIAGRAVDESPDRRVVQPRAERLANQLLARAPRQLAEMDPHDAAIGPQSRKLVVDFGPREREHHQRSIGQLAHDRIDEPHRRQIAPLQILEDPQ